MPIKPPDEGITKLLASLGLDINSRKIVSVDIHIKVGKFVTMDVVEIVDEIDGKEAEALKHYRLEEIKINNQA